MKQIIIFLILFICVTLFTVDYIETRQTAMQAWEWHISFAAPEIGKLRAQDNINKYDLEREILFLKRRIKKLEEKP